MDNYGFEKALDVLSRTIIKLKFIFNLELYIVVKNI